VADLANSVSSGKSLSHYGPYFFFWKRAGGGHEHRVSFLLHSCESERITVGGRNTHMLWLRRSDSFRMQREWVGKEGEKEKEPITNVTEHLPEF
jgi:hypothetical protein